MCLIKPAVRGQQVIPASSNGLTHPSPLSIYPWTKKTVTLILFSWITLFISLIDLLYFSSSDTKFQPCRMTFNPPSTFYDKIYFQWGKQMIRHFNQQQKYSSCHILVDKIIFAGHENISKDSKFINLLKRPKNGHSCRILTSSCSYNV